MILYINNEFKYELTYCTFDVLEWCIRMEWILQEEYKFGDVKSASKFRYKFGDRWHLGHKIFSYL